MSKQSTSNELYWKAKQNSELKSEYATFLSSRNLKGSPHNAQLFAMNCMQGEFKYMGLSEREIILVLEKELPLPYE